MTPNADEAAVLTGRDIDTPEDAEAAGHDIVAMGADAALVKGGHVPGDDVVDVLVAGDSVTTFRHDRIDTEATHGSGCTLSSAIATRLAHGDDLQAAVGAGIDLLARAVRYNLDVGEGPGAVHHTVQRRNEAARHETGERVEGVVSALVEADVSPLVPDAGLTVVGATPYAESPGEVAGVEGGIARTVDGVRPNRGVRFAVSTAAARRLLALREFSADYRLGVTCRPSDAVVDALDALDAPVATYDPSDRPASVSADEAIEWGVERAVADLEDAPAAVVERAAVGSTGAVMVVAPDAETLLDRVDAVLEHVS